jgi:hypothetical protein
MPALNLFKEGMILHHDIAYLHCVFLLKAVENVARKVFH